MADPHFGHFRSAVMGASQKNATAFPPLGAMAFRLHAFIPGVAAQKM
jgi:hypothetical protein